MGVYIRWYPKIRLPAVILFMTWFSKAWAALTLIRERRTISNTLDLIFMLGYLRGESIHAVFVLSHLRYLVWWSARYSTRQIHSLFNQLSPNLRLIRWILLMFITAFVSINIDAINKLIYDNFRLICRLEVYNFVWLYKVLFKEQ